MNNIDIKIGQVVYSKAGRDKGRYFIIVGLVDELHVYVADGDLRKIEKPKKKKLKHLVLTGEMCEWIIERINLKRRINNSEIRQYLLGFSGESGQTDSNKDSLSVDSSRNE